MRKAIRTSRSFRRKLHYEPYDVKHEDEIPTATRPQTNKRLCHISAEQRDKSWTHRMDGFTGMSMSNVRRGSSKKQRDANCIDLIGQKSPTQVTQESSVPSIDDIDSPPASQRKSDVASQISTDINLSIEDYSSEDESIGEEDTQEQGLSSCESAPSTAMGDPAQGACTESEKKVKASDWVKKLQWLSEEAQGNSACAFPENIEQEETVMDSAKKKKPRYVKDGLADRLQRLLQRQKSAKAFWAHKLMKTGTQAENCGVRLGVKTVEKGSGTIRCEMKVLEIGTSNAKLRQGDSVDALMTLSGCDDVTVGSTVVLHPPWKIMTLSGSRPLLLCTDHSQVVKAGFLSPDIGRRDAESRCWQPHVLSTWTCPCTKDPTLAASECRALLCPVQWPPQSPSPAALSRLSEDPPPSTCSATSHLVRSVTCVSATPCDPQPRGQSILDSIGRSAGGRSVAFSAVIQRVCCRRVKKPQRCGDDDGACGRSWSLLVQDRVGFLVEVQLQAGMEHVASWQRAIHEGEGRSATFHGLHVVQRTSRTRCPRLFSLIDSVWRPEAVDPIDASSQDSSQQCVGAAVVVRKAEFSYVLQATLGEAHVTVATEPSPRHDSPSVYTAPLTTSLQHCLGAGNTTAAQRVSFSGKIIFQTSPPASMELYVCDTTLAVGYARLQVAPGALLPGDAGHYPAFFFRDVSSVRGTLCLDGYSRLLPLETEARDRLRHIGVTLADISDAVKENDLVWVDGEIMGVDESTAFSWLECNVCGGDQLQENKATRSDFYCCQCEQLVRDPKQRINLEVLMVDLNAAGVSIRIRLQESTIKKLLPSETEDQGYDVQCVLGQRPGRLTGMVTEVLSNVSVHLDEVNVI